MQKITFLLIAVILGSFDSALAEGFKAGQIWNYETRPNETGSTVTIARIDEFDKIGAIYHIVIDGVSIAAPDTPIKKLTNIPHLPVTIETLSASVTTLTGTADMIPDISEGYTYWREAFDQGDAGAFDIPISDIIEGVEFALSTQPTNIN